MLRDKVRTTYALSVNEIYESIQGEGLLLGTLSVFIRLQGCNLRCPWCDQPNALEFKKISIPIEEITKKALSFRARHAVITGGEPLAQQNLHVLVRDLLSEGFSVQIETNGTLWHNGLETLADKIHITCSPKAVAKFFVHPRVLRWAKELKFVVDEEFSAEVLFREEFTKFLRENKVVLQPESNKRAFLTKALGIQKEMKLRGFNLRVLPQAHKIFGLR